jgi:hypothetical protein
MDSLEGYDSIDEYEVYVVPQVEEESLEELDHLLEGYKRGGYLYAWPGNIPFRKLAPGQGDIEKEVTGVSTNQDVLKGKGLKSHERVEEKHVGPSSANEAGVDVPGSLTDKCVAVDADHAAHIHLPEDTVEFHDNDKEIPEDTVEFHDNDKEIDNKQDDIESEEIPPHEPSQEGGESAAECGGLFVSKTNEIKSRVNNAIELEQDTEEPEPGLLEKATKYTLWLRKPLSEFERNILEAAFSSIGDDKEEVIKNETAAGAPAITRGHLLKLKPGVWLGDNAITCFFRCLLCERDTRLHHKSKQQRRQCHFLPSFFYTKLMSEGDKSKEQNAHARNVFDYEGVKRFGKKAPGGNIFLLDKMFIPINVGKMHWVLVVVFFDDRIIRLYDSLANPTRGPEQLGNILQYLREEHKAANGCELPDDWRLGRCGDKGSCPQQQNGACKPKMMLKKCALTVFPILNFRLSTECRM